jgi:hypothetical protein
MRERFSVSALVPMLFGASIPAEREIEAYDELSITLYGELGEVLRTRIEGSVDDGAIRGDSALRRAPNADRWRASRHQARRRECPKTRP